MKAITHNDLRAVSYNEKPVYLTHKNAWTRFIEYAEKQESNRFWWLALAILGHGTIFTIATLAVVTMLGNVFALYAIACCTMAMVVIVNLAALPAKYTIPVFFLSLLIDILVIIAAIVLY